jgi:Fe-S-cluster containining protein
MAARRKGIDDADTVSKLLCAFPYAFNLKGECEKLFNGLCTVYDKRPIVCDVDKMWALHYSDNINQKDFYALNKMKCGEIGGK